jgi:probable rRNA maturation factor
VQVEISNRQKTVRCPVREIRRVLQLALGTEGRDAELSVALVGDHEMADLNARFLGRGEVTDVLAFPYSAEGGPLAGEIVVNAELAAREAAGRAHSAPDELLLYIVHGLLHLLGYDDHKAPDRRRMRRREAEVLEAAGRKVEF